MAYLLTQYLVVELMQNKKTIKASKQFRTAVVIQIAGHFKLDKTLQLFCQNTGKFNCFHLEPPAAPDPLRQENQNRFLYR